MGDGEDCRNACGRAGGRGCGCFAGDLCVDPSEVLAEEGLLTLKVAETFAHGGEFIAAWAGGDGKTKKGAGLESPAPVESDLRMDRA